jgi:hypothetical protein
MSATGTGITGITSSQQGPNEPSEQTDADHDRKVALNLAKLTVLLTALGVLVAIVNPVSLFHQGSESQQSASGSAPVNGPVCSTPTPHPSVPHASPATGPSATITDPPGSSMVAYESLPLSGTVQNIPRGYGLDLFQQYKGSVRYFPAGNASAVSVNNGHWSGSIDLGQPGPFSIMLVLLSPSDVSWMNSQNHVPDLRNGLSSLPGTVLAHANYTACS